MNSKDMSMETLAIQGIVEELECSICLDPLRDARVLICGHVFCLGCLQSMNKRGGGLDCPICRKTHLLTKNTAVEDIPKVTMVNNMQEKLEKMLRTEESDNDDKYCSACSDDGEENALAKVVCIKCDVNLCQTCERKHRKKLTGHHILHLDPKAMCSQHPRKLMMIFCLDCKSPACFLCSIKHHRGHTTVNLASHAAEKTASIKKELLNLQEEQSELKKKKLTLDALLLEFEAKHDSAKSDVENRAQAIIKLTENTIEGLVTELKHTMETETKPWILKSKEWAVNIERQECTLKETGILLAEMLETDIIKNWQSISDRIRTHSDEKETCLPNFANKTPKLEWATDVMMKQIANCKLTFCREVPNEAKNKPPSVVEPSIMGHRLPKNIAKRPDSPGCNKRGRKCPPPKKATEEDNMNSDNTIPANQLRERKSKTDVSSCTWFNLNSRTLVVFAVLLLMATLVYLIIQNPVETEFEVEDLKPKARCTKKHVSAVRSVMGYIIQIDRKQCAARKNETKDYGQCIKEQYIGKDFYYDEDDDENNDIDCEDDYYKANEVHFEEEYELEEYEEEEEGEEDEDEEEEDIEDEEEFENDDNTVTDFLQALNYQKVVSFKVGSALRDMVVDPKSNTIFVVQTNGSIDAYDINGIWQLDITIVPFNIHRIVYDSQGKYFVAATRKDILFIDRNTFEIFDKVSVPYKIIDVNVCYDRQYTFYLATSESYAKQRLTTAISANGEDISQNFASYVSPGTNPAGSSMFACDPSTRPSTIYVSNGIKIHQYDPFDEHNIIEMEKYRVKPGKLHVTTQGDLIIIDKASSKILLMSALHGTKGKWKVLLTKNDLDGQRPVVVSTSQDGILVVGTADGTLHVFDNSL